MIILDIILLILYVFLLLDCWINENYIGFMGWFCAITMIIRIMIHG